MYMYICMHICAYLYIHVFYKPVGPVDCKIRAVVCMPRLGRIGFVGLTSSAELQALGGEASRTVSRGIKLHVSTSAHVYYIYIYIHIYVHANMNMCMRVCILLYLYVNIRTTIHTHIYTYVYMYVCMYVCMYTCMRMMLPRKFRTSQRQRRC